MTIELAVLSPHVPSIVYEENVPDFQKEMVEGMKRLSKEIDKMNPDAIVLVSCHWPSTFFHYVDGTQEHKGLMTAAEAPDLIKDVPYHFPGEPELARNLVKAGQEVGLDVKEMDDPYYVWDYGSVVPLRYLTPKSNIPVINLSVTLAASLEETYQWGQVIAEQLKNSDKKYVFLASGALSHNLVRGRHHIPTVSEHALDKQFVNFLENKQYEEAYQMLPEYARMAKVESGGRHLAMLFAMIEKNWLASYLADGQSSGSWNALITFAEKDYSHLAGKRKMVLA